MSNPEATQSLVPLSGTVLNLVYGSDEYIESVFGRRDITRSDLLDYYDWAVESWTRYPIPKGVERDKITRWCRQQKIGSLHYYAPFTEKTIFFREPEQAMICALRFGR